MSAPGQPLLRVEDLRVEFPTEGGVVHAVNGVSFEVAHGRTLGIVGGSGSGKSVCALSAMGLTRAAGARVSGRILFEGVDLLALPERGMRALRGNELAMIFQDPLSTLHPVQRVGAQIVEAIRAHSKASTAKARDRVAELFDIVGLQSELMDRFPHEFSGGMRQRAMIAIALAFEPALLVMDEPTTGLDVLVQAQILALLRRLRAELGMALVLVTHDLGVVAEMAEEIVVMQAGLIVERGSAARVLTAPEHPYTQGLLRSMPTLAGPGERGEERAGDGKRAGEKEEEEEGGGVGGGGAAAAGARPR